MEGWDCDVAMGYGADGIGMKCHAGILLSWDLSNLESISRCTKLKTIDPI